MKICFTVILGNYDTLKQPKIISRGWRYICITDQEFKEPGVWEIIKPPIIDVDNRILSRYVFNCIHNIIPNVSMSILVGGATEIKTDLNLLEKNYLRGYDMAVLKHPYNETVTDEIKCVKEREQEELFRIERIEKLYSNLNFNAPVYKLGLVMRNHSPKVNLVGEELFRMVKNYTYREQILFPYVLQKFNIRLNVIQRNLFEKEFFKHKHL